MRSLPNGTFDRTAGSRSLAAAGQPGRAASLGMATARPPQKVPRVGYLKGAPVRAAELLHPADGAEAAPQLMRSLGPSEVSMRPEPEPTNRR